MKPWAGGILHLLGVNEVADGPLANPSIDKPWVDGFRLRIGWDELQPTSAAIAPDWTVLDNWISVCATKDKFIALTIFSGQQTPDWVYDDAPTCERFPFIDNDLVSQNKPYGFDANYLNKWEAFVTLFAARYDSNPTVHAVHYAGYGQDVIEYHVTSDPTDEALWNAKAIAAGFSTGKSEALRYATDRVINKFKSVFTNTSLLFTEGNPWSGGSAGQDDEQHAEETSISTPNSGICNSFLKAITTHDGIVTRVNYPHGYQAISNSTDDRFYSDISPPFPDAPVPMHDLIHTGVEKGQGGAQYIEIYKFDVNGGHIPSSINDQEFIDGRLLLLNNLPGGLAMENLILESIVVG